jgi:hypothetical protein
MLRLQGVVRRSVFLSSRALSQTSSRASSTSPLVTVEEAENGVATITLNSPERLNALTGE